MFVNEQVTSPTQNDSVDGQTQTYNVGSEESQGGEEEKTYEGRRVKAQGGEEEDRRRRADMIIGLGFMQGFFRRQCAQILTNALLSSSNCISILLCICTLPLGGSKVFLLSAR